MTRKTEEIRAQQLVYAWVLKNYPDIFGYKISNEGKRSPRLGLQMKLEGLRKGVPDLCFNRAKGGFHGIYVEMKKLKGGKLSDEQKEAIVWLNSEGYLSLPCNGDLEAKNILKLYFEGTLRRILTMNDNKTVYIDVKRINGNVDLETPSRKTRGSAGADLVANLTEPLIINPGELKMFGTGWAMAIPDGFMGEIRPRSSMGLKLLFLMNSPATIDSDYRGEIKLGFVNLGKVNQTIQPGDRVAQLIIQEVRPVQFEIMESLDDTERGSGGFGSTGR